MEAEKSIIVMWLLDNETNRDTVMGLVSNLTDGQVYALFSAIQLSQRRPIDDIY